MSKITAEDIALMSDEEIESMDFPPISSSGTKESEEVVEESQDEQENHEESDNMGIDSNLDNNSVTPYQGEPEEQEKEEEKRELTPETALEFYNKLNQPFKANGKLITIDKPEEWIKLAQMGANYSRKMENMKQYTGIIQAFKENNITNPQDINLVIDVLKGNPNAIKTIAEKHNIDFYNLSNDSGSEEETQYTPNNYIPNPNQLEFEEVVAELQESPYGSRIMQEVKTWDSESVTEIVGNPRVLQFLDNHASTGLYDDTMAILEKAKLLGQLPSNKKIIDAYDEVATQLLANNPSKYQVNSVNTQTQPKVVGNNLQPQYIPQKQNSSKRQASPPRGSTNAIAKQNVMEELANASDEDIERSGSLEELLFKLKQNR